MYENILNKLKVRRNEIKKDGKVIYPSDRDFKSGYLSAIKDAIKIVEEEKKVIDAMFVKAQKNIKNMADGIVEFADEPTVQVNTEGE